MIYKSLQRLNQILIKCSGKPFFYHKLVLKNQIRRAFKKENNHKFLFILSPPYCGSTLLAEVISTSKVVSVCNPKGLKEGQRIPEVESIMFKNRRKRWDETTKMDWSYIKREWMRYWNLSRPVLLEKSPPNIIRANSINRTFSPAYFIILFRNPYAHCEGLIRRNKLSPEKAAKKSILCLKYQKKNISELNHVVPLSYEHLTTNPGKAIKEVTEMIPELSDINPEKKFEAHNFKKEKKKMKIINLNPEKVRRLSKEQINQINAVFEKEKELLNYFGYRLN